MSKALGIAALAVGALAPFGISTRADAAAQVLAKGRVSIVEVDGVAVSQPSVSLPAGIHLITAEFRDYGATTQCVFSCRVADSGTYQVIAGLRGDGGTVRFAVEGGHFAPELIWAHGGPAAKIIIGRSIDVRLAHFQRPEFLPSSFSGMPAGNPATWDVTPNIVTAPASTGATRRN